MNTPAVCQAIRAQTARFTRNWSHCSSFKNIILVSRNQLLNTVELVWYHNFSIVQFQKNKLSETYTSMWTEVLQFHFQNITIFQFRKKNNVPLVTEVAFYRCVDIQIKINITISRRSLFKMEIKCNLLLFQSDSGCFKIYILAMFSCLNFILLWHI